MILFKGKDNLHTILNSNHMGRSNSKHFPIFKRRQSSFFSDFTSFLSSHRENLEQMNKFSNLLKWKTHCCFTCLQAEYVQKQEIDQDEKIGNIKVLQNIFYCLLMSLFFLVVFIVARKGTNGDGSKESCCS